jgi:hypothetical protein
MVSRSPAVFTFIAIGRVRRFWLVALSSLPFSLSPSPSLPIPHAGIAQAPAQVLVPIRVDPTQGEPSEPSAPPRSDPTRNRIPRTGHGTHRPAHCGPSRLPAACRLRWHGSGASWPWHRRQTDRADDAPDPGGGYTADQACRSRGLITRSVADGANPGPGALRWR